MKKLCIVNFDEVIVELKEAIFEEGHEREQRRLPRLVTKLESLREID